MKEAIALIEKQIEAHRNKAGLAQGAAESYQSNADHQRAAARIYYDLIAELEQAKHDIERAQAKRGPA